MVLISELADFQAWRLRQVIEEVFAARATHELPTQVPPPPPQWTRPYRGWIQIPGVDTGKWHGFSIRFSPASKRSTGGIVKRPRGGFRRHVWRTIGPLTWLNGDMSSAAASASVHRAEHCASKWPLAFHRRRLSSLLGAWVPI
jgi:hypothetical protein